MGQLASRSAVGDLTEAHQHCQPRADNWESAMKITLTSVLVDDQGKALKFYTDVLGFVKKKDIPGGEFKFLTVSRPMSRTASNSFSSPMRIPPPRRSRRPSTSKAFRRQHLSFRTCRRNMSG